MFLGGEQYSSSSTHNSANVELKEQDLWDSSCNVGARNSSRALRDFILTLSSSVLGDSVQCFWAWRCRETFPFSMELRFLLRTTSHYNLLVSAHRRMVIITNCQCVIQTRDLYIMGWTRPPSFAL